jgi:radical SAM family uncharacterized protein
MAPFIDAFVVGEADEALLEVLQAYRNARRGHAARHEILRELAQVPGVYVPSLYKVSYDDTGRLAAIEPTVPEAQMPVIKRTVHPLPPVPPRPIVPYVQTVHDRATIEIMRGCTQGCRFCQAGMIYRPLRERSRGQVVQAAHDIVRCTGYPEVGLISLSSADHSQIRGIVEDLLAPSQGPPLSVSLPSLRTDAFSVELAKLFAQHSGLTFAPEAGSQRLRDVINKKVSEQDLFRAAEAAYANHWQRIKLYFMIGLPTETDEDVTAIVDLVDQVAEIGRQYHGRKANVSVTVSTLVPKPHTPFQWHPLLDEESLRRRQDLLKTGLHQLKAQRQIRFSYHDTRTSLLEAIIARGDRRLGPVIEHAWRKGARFDAWNEQFRWDAWLDAFESATEPVVMDARRERQREEVLPWDHVSCGVNKDYLWHEYERAMRGQTTRDCRDGCTNCGAIERLECTGGPSLGASSVGSTSTEEQ